MRINYLEGDKCKRFYQVISIGKLGDELIGRVINALTIRLMAKYQLNTAKKRGNI